MLVYKSSGSMFYDYPYQSPDQYQAQVRIPYNTHLYLNGIHILLKIDSNEKWDGQKDGNGRVLVWDCGNQWLFAIWTCCFV